MNLFELWLGLIVGLAVAGWGRSQELPQTDWPISSYMTKRYLSQNDELALNWIKQKVDGQSFASLGQVPQFLRQCQRDLLIYEAPETSMAVAWGSTGVANKSLHVLIDLADSRSECTMDQITRYIGLADLLYGGLNRLAQAGPTEARSNGLSDYMHSFGRDKFTNCWRKQGSKKLRHPQVFDARTERAFDEVVLSQDKWTGQSRTKMNDQHITQVARTINLLGSFDGHGMLRAASKYSLFRDKVERVPSTYLIQSLVIYCSRLSTDYDLLLNLYNLSRAWGPAGVWATVSTGRLLKLNEFGRLCHQLLNPDTTVRAQANIQRQIS